MEAPLIGDIDDLQDHLDIFEATVSELHSGLSPAELHVVSDMQTLAEYIRLEDSIRAGLLLLSKTLKDSDERKLLVEAVQKFNQLGSEQQDSWPDSQWQVYESIRGGYASPRRSPTRSDLNTRITQVVDIALTLNRDERRQKSVYSTEVLHEVDSLAKRYPRRTNLREQFEIEYSIAAKSCKCTIF